MSFYFEFEQELARRYVSELLAGRPVAIRRGHDLAVLAGACLSLMRSMAGGHPQMVLAEADHKELREAKEERLEQDLIAAIRCAADLSLVVSVPRGAATLAPEVGAVVEAIAARPFWDGQIAPLPPPRVGACSNP